MSITPDALYPTIRQALQAVHAPVPEEEWAFMVQQAQGLFLPKGEHLIQTGDPVDTLYFIHEGALRVYYVHEGVTYTRSFAFEGRFYTNSYSFNTRTPSHYAVEALEDTHLTRIDRATIEMAYERHPYWSTYARKAAQQNFIQKEQKEMTMRIYSPEEHYWQLVETGSPIVSRVPLYHIASYLGITPETLSRIRRRMAHAKAANKNGAARRWDGSASFC